MELGSYGADLSWDEGIGPGSSPFGETEQLQEKPWSFPGPLALVLAVYLMSVPTMSYSMRLQASWVPQALGALLVLLWFVAGLPAQGWRIYWAKSPILYLVWVLWATIGVLSTLNVTIFWESWLTAFKVAIVTMVAAQCVRKRADMLVVWLFVGLASLIIFVADRSLILSSATLMGRSVQQRAAGTLAENANALAFYALVGVIGGLGFFFSFKSMLVKILVVLAMSIQAVIVAGSGSRKGAICLALIGVGVYFFHLRRVGKGQALIYKIILFFGGAAIGLATIYYVSSMPFFYRVEESMTSVSAIQREARWYYMLTALRATAEHPIVGLGIEGFTMRLSGSAGHYSHSTVSESLVATGVPGFIMIYWALFHFLNFARKVRKLSLPRPDLAVVNMIFIFALLFIVFGLAAVTLQERLAWPMIGAACGYMRQLQLRYGDAPMPQDEFADA